MSLSPASVNGNVFGRNYMYVFVRASVCRSAEPH